MMVSMQLKHECKDPTHHKVEPSCKAHLSAADTIRKFAKKSVCCSCLTSRLSNQPDLTSLDVTTDVLTDAIADSVPRSLGFSQSDTASKAHDQAMSDTASRAQDKGMTNSRSKSQTDHSILPTSANILSKVEESITEKGEFVVRKLSAIKDTISDLNLAMSEQSLAGESKSNAKAEIVEITITDHSRGKNDLADKKVVPDATLSEPSSQYPRTSSPNNTSDRRHTESPQQPTKLSSRKSSMLSYSETEPATHNRTAVPESEPSLPTDPVSVLRTDTPAITITNPSRSSSSKRHESAISGETTEADSAIQSPLPEDNGISQKSATNDIMFTSNEPSRHQTESLTMTELKRLADRTTLSGVSEKSEPTSNPGLSSNPESADPQQNNNDKVKSTEV